MEEDGAWLDEVLGGPEVRKALIERLNKMDQWDPRYARLQSAYFQALAQNFQFRAKKDQDTKKKKK